METNPSLKRCALITLYVIMFVWLIKVIEIVFDFDFVAYGVYPRNIDMLLGILTAPLIHGSFEHLFANDWALDREIWSFSTDFNPVEYQVASVIIAS